MTTPEAPVTRWALLVLAVLLVPLAAPLFAQSPAPAQPAPAASQVKPALPHASTPASRAGKGVAVANKPVTSPLWRELSPSQQQALVPLAAHWDTLSEPHKRKWIALSANFPKMSGEEQAKLHSRMTEWVSLSPQQRTIARLNYGATQKLSPDDKKAKWEAYQALPPEEKKKLAAKAAKPPATAAAIRPVPADKLAAMPKTRQAQAPASKAPRIAAAPGQVDHRTLLPQPQQQPARVLPAQQSQPQQPPPPAPQPQLPPQAGTPD
jgi:hypothetical protein